MFDIEDGHIEDNFCGIMKSLPRLRELHFVMMSDANKVNNYGYFNEVHASTEYSVIYLYFLFISLEIQRDKMFVTKIAQFIDSNVFFGLTTANDGFKHFQFTLNRLKKHVSALDQRHLKSNHLLIIS